MQWPPRVDGVHGRGHRVRRGLMRGQTVAEKSSLNAGPAVRDQTDLEAADGP